MRTTLLAALSVGALVGGFIVPVANADNAVAATASEFDAGYLIDDAVFYDANAMTAVDIQAFLNSKVANCSPTATCLKNYGQATGNIAADNYCNGYQGAAYQTAAQIIDLVARSCGISQRALLVLLEKEQSLVTSRSPSSWSYTAATGMGCPDTAPCDASLAGFFYQVYYGARQFEIYRLKPNSFNHRAGAWNNVRLSPSASCGTKSVFIYNQATAGLYNYTPYTPDDAALNNLYGTGGACSTYGNRNFWRLFTDWFGNPKTYTVHGGLEPYWTANGGASGPIGAPISYAVYVEQNGQGWYQAFRGGTIYASMWGGTVFVANNVISAEYQRFGGPYAWLGWPNGEQYCVEGLRCAQSFVNGVIATTPQYGAHMISGGFRSYWDANGGLGGSLGAPLNDMVYYPSASSQAWSQSFQSGVLVQSAVAGFQLVPYGPILNSWLAQGGGTGYLGWPMAAQVCDGSSCSQPFQGGVVASTPWFGVQTISGGFVAEWQSRGGMEGSLGVPFGPMRYAATPTQVWAQNFAGGILTQSAVAGFKLVPYGPGQAFWTSNNEFRGGYGAPVTERICGSQGCFQEFSGGIISESVYGANGTYGGIAAQWKASSGATEVGPALNGIRHSAVHGGGWAQHFASGVITQGGGSSVFTPYSPILSTWYYYGAEYTWLGWPVSAQSCSSGGCVQEFQFGTATSTPSGGVSFSGK